MKLMPYEDFKSSKTIGYGTPATSDSANKAPLFIKSELNDLYNYVKTKFNEDPFEWDSRESYRIGDLVVLEDIIYIAIAANSNSMPLNADWALFESDSLDLRYLQIISTEYIKLSDRSTHKMMSSGSDKTTAIMTSKNGLVAWDDGVSSDIGTSVLRFKNIYGVNGYFHDINTTTIEGTTATFDTVDASEFIGVSSTAKYADIAEKYTSDITYDAGTVLGFGGDEEVTIYNEGMKLAGVVSSNPGYMLNSDIDGIYIALKGRVPCKIIGNANKGDYIIASNDGLGIAVNEYTFDESKKLLGIAIYNSINNLVEIKV